MRDSKQWLFSYFSEDKEEWRTEHVITWLAGDVPRASILRISSTGSSKNSIAAVSRTFQQPSSHLLYVAFIIVGNTRLQTKYIGRYVKEPHSTIVCECWHDLESALKVIWIIVFGYRTSPLFRIDGADAKSLLEFWERAEAAALPKSLLQAARAADYSHIHSISLF